MPSYIALIRKEPGSDYGVEFPDFPGCVTAGIDLDDARRMAAEALALHIKGMLEDGETLPAPSAPETVMRDALNREAVGFLVDTPAAGAASVRVNITLPQDLLEAIDRVAGNRSRFLAEAARSKLRTG
jgi:predicted RNase H-like HicB family nuclease